MMRIGPNIRFILLHKMKLVSMYIYTQNKLSLSSVLGGYLPLTALSAPSLFHKNYVFMSVCVHTVGLYQSQKKKKDNRG